MTQGSGGTEDQDKESAAPKTPQPGSGWSVPGGASDTPPPYETPTYSQPDYGQPPTYSQPAAQPPAYGQPAQPEYGQQPPTYGQPAQPDYGQPPSYGQPPQPEFGQLPGYPQQPPVAPGQPPMYPQPAYGQVPPTGGYPPAGYGGPVGQQPPNHMAWAIISTVAGVLCCITTIGGLGFIPGIVSIVFAGQVNSKWAMGDYAGAQNSSNQARIWAIVATAIEALGLIIGIIWLIVAVSNSHSSSY